MRADYLGIPEPYCRALGGPRWSRQDQAIEYSDGRTFAFAPEVRSFLEGFASRGPLVHFGHVLHFMYLLRQGKTTRHDFAPLAAAWRAAGRPARTAGVVAALLCREVPPVPCPPAAEELIATLFAVRTYHPAGLRADDPPLDPEVFEAVLACELERFSFPELVHWFRHAQGPLAAQGEELAEE